jgi:hypothetical protein
MKRMGRILLALGLAAAALAAALVHVGGGDDDASVRAAPRELRMARAPTSG